MATSELNPNQREFRCVHCTGKILIPKDLPPTTGPCPHCGKQITSPGPDLQNPFEGPLAEGGAPPPVPPPPMKPPLQTVGYGGTVVERGGGPAVPLPPEAALPKMGPSGPVRLKAASAVPAPPVGGMDGDGLPDEIGAQGVVEVPGRKRGLGVVFVILLLLVTVGAGGYFFVLPKFVTPAPVPMVVQPSAAKPSVMSEEQWERKAREVLEQFVRAETVAGKAASSIRGSDLLPVMSAFHEGRRVAETDTPAEAFAVYPLSEEDRMRGIFMMVFDQPAAEDVTEFFMPVVPLRVAYGLEEPGLLLSTWVARDDFSVEPLKVQALFKQTAAGLKVDWATFVQTKYRTLRDFLEIADPGRSEVFRVILTETVPDRSLAPAGHRTYLVADPAHGETDKVKVNVPTDSVIGRTLAVLNWRGTTDSRPTSRTATIELRWSEDEVPRLEVGRFICWEFLGVGGEAANPGG